MEGRRRLVACTTSSRKWPSILEARIASPRLASVLSGASHSLSVMLEEQEVRIAKGEEIDVSSYSHMSSTLVRLAARIGLKRIAKDVTPDPLSYARQFTTTATQEVK
jgi:hypothetical protein